MQAILYSSTSKTNVMAFLEDEPNRVAVVVVDDIALEQVHLTVCTIVFLTTQTAAYVKLYVRENCEVSK